MHIKDYAQAQGWFRKHAAAPSSVGSWKAFVARNKKVQEPRTMAQEPRIGLKPGGIVEPGVTHYATYEKKSKKIKIGDKVYNFTGIKPSQVTSIEEGVKTLAKWKKNPTLENWIATFRLPSKTGQAHQSDFSISLRRYFQGKDIPEQTKQIFDKIKIKKIIGQSGANKIRTYTTEAGNILKATKAGILASKAKKTGSMTHINAIRDAFVWDPDSGLKDLAKFMYGEDFTKGSLKIQERMLNEISNDVPKFLEALNGARMVKNFKMPNTDTILDIIDNIENNKSGFKFQEGTLRTYKFNIRDAELMLPEGTSVADRARLQNLKKGMGLALDETGTLSGTYTKAPGYTSGSQLIDNLLNTKKRKLIDKDFSNVLKAMVNGDPTAMYQWRGEEVTRDELVKNYNAHAEKFKNKYKIDAPTIEIGVNPKNAVSNYKLYSKAEQSNMQSIFKNKNFSIGFGEATKPVKALETEFTKLLETVGGRKFLKQQITAQTYAKVLAKNGFNICSSGRVIKALGGRAGYAEKVCGINFATDDPLGFLNEAKRSTQEVKGLTATKWLAKQGSKGATQLLNAARVVARDTANPIGWIGGDLIISGAISAVMKAEGATTREALDQGLLWFLPKGVLAAEATEYKKQAEALGLPFKDIEKFMKLEENDRAMYEIGDKTSEWEEQAEIGGTGRYRADPIEDQKRERLEDLRQRYILEYGEEYGTKLAQQQANAMGVPLKGTYTQPYLTKARQRLHEIDQESKDIIGGLKAEHGENWANPYFNLQDVKEKTAYEKEKRKQKYEEIRARQSEQIIHGGIDESVDYKLFPEFKPVEYVPGKGFDYKYYMPDEFGMAGGGLANLTRTVAPDSEGIMSLKKKR